MPARELERLLRYATPASRGFKTLQEQGIVEAMPEDDRTDSTLWWHTTGQYCVSTDRAHLDLDLIHRVLRESYWSPGIPLDVVRRAIDTSLPFGAYSASGHQIGFARVVTDRATFAYVADVFVLEAERGRGLGKWLMSVVVQHPELQGLRRWLLATRDAHSLYAQFGFTPLRAPDRFMERHDPDVYSTSKE